MNEQKTTLPSPGTFYLVKWIAAVSLFLTLTAVMIVAHAQKLQHQTGELKKEIEKGRFVLVAPFKRMPRTRTITLPASVHGYIETNVYAKIPGYLKRILVDKGDRVKKGQILALIESPETDKQVQNARAAYEIALITDRRNQALVKQGVIPQQTADQSHATMLQDRASLNQLLAMQGYEVIKADFSGIVTARYVDQGALIPAPTGATAQQTPIVALATLSPLRVYANVPQDLARYIRDGDQASLTLSDSPEGEIHGSVTRHPDALDPTTRTMLVEVDLSNEDRSLLPGMYVTATFTVSVPEGAPLVPDDALVFRDGKPYVPVVRENRMRLIPVRLGFDNGTEVQVVGNLRSDELVALNAGQSARDGEVVRPVLRGGHPVGGSQQKAS
jgi:RND family efflux transporter MFP subunit